MGAGKRYLGRPGGARTLFGGWHRNVSCAFEMKAISLPPELLAQDARQRQQFFGSVPLCKNSERLKT
jgi:hypothetical protein